MAEGLHGVTFQRETLSPELAAELMPLLEAHYLELAHYHDIRLEPDFDRYYRAQLLGELRIYTARLEHRAIGYGVFFIQRHMHYAGSKQAAQDLVYLEINSRGKGIGSALVDWCEARLAEEGVQVLSQHVKAAHPMLGQICEKRGYDLQDLIYTKRLDVKLPTFPVPTHNAEAV